MFLAFWLPYNNGLRPEPIVALGALLTWCSIERAIATGRLLPAATAVIIGAFTLAAAPTGLMCVAALIAGIRPMTRIVVRRHREVGTLPLLAPIGAAGVLVLVVVFADQTLAAVLEATRVRTIIGPNEEWCNDFLRYYYLFVQTVDGSLARRFAFLVDAAVPVHDDARAAASQANPRRRHRARRGACIGIVFGTMFFMMFNPTKWTHHFGAYAGIAGSLAALTAVARLGQCSAVATQPHDLPGRSALRPRAVVLRHQRLLVRLELRRSVVRQDRLVPGHPVEHRCSWSCSAARARSSSPGSTCAKAMRRHRRNRRRARAAVSASSRPRRSPSSPRLMVLFEVLSLLKGAVSQYPAYSLGRSNIGALAGDTCGLAERRARRDRPQRRAVSTPITDPANPPADRDPLAGSAPRRIQPERRSDRPHRRLRRSQTRTGQHRQPERRPHVRDRPGGGTTGGRGAQTVNGSTARLPFGLDPAVTPVLGSYQQGVQEPASLTSSWYQLPERADDVAAVVLSAAGRIWSVRRHRCPDTTDSRCSSSTASGCPTAPSRRRAHTCRGTSVPHRRGGTCGCRSRDLPEDTDAVRIVANDPNLTGDQWLAFTPPRVPVLDTLDSVIGIGAARPAGLGRGSAVPVPAAVRSLGRCRRDAELPHPPRPSARGVVDRHVAVGGQRWPARLHRDARPCRTRSRRT